MFPEAVPLLLPEEEEDGVRDLLRGRPEDEAAARLPAWSSDEEACRPAAELGLEVGLFFSFLLSPPDDRPRRTPPPRTPTLPFE